ncbi:MAG: hypothetical protein A2Z88_05395 [Omnitrophica WOR_2 bacterium GWA2_47_8]|nr:MAG: hypothetical protein A2Z88_05395 [Omnitrophica WOR_2 bacterium GWA2_47_8]
MKLKIIALGLAFLLLNLGYALAEESTETTAKYCLVCGPEEETEGLSVSYKYEGKKYSFCSMDCLKAFKKNPEQYLNAKDFDTGHTDHQVGK